MHGSSSLLSWSSMLTFYAGEQRETVVIVQVAIGAAEVQVTLRTGPIRAIELVDSDAGSGRKFEGRLGEEVASLILRSWPPESPPPCASSPAWPRPASRPASRRPGPLRRPSRQFFLNPPAARRGVLCRWWRVAQGMHGAGPHGREERGASRWELRLRIESFSVQRQGHARRELLWNRGRLPAQR